MHSGFRGRKVVVLGGLLLAGAAWASPWDIDMIDAYMYKAFEWKMRMPPVGTVPRESTSAPRPQDAGYYQNAKITNADRTTEAGKALTNPYPVDATSIATGKTMFYTYCQACHGPEGKGGGPVTHNDPSADIRRFPVPAPMLSGPGAVTAHKSDGYVYLTIRNGGAIMPAYGLSMTDAERWSVVAYIRTLDGAQNLDLVVQPPVVAPIEVVTPPLPPPGLAPRQMPPLGAPRPPPSPLLAPTPPAGSHP